MKTTVRAAILTLLLTLALAPAAAMAQDPSIDTYGGGGGDVLSSTDQSSDTSGELPFTGLDLMFVGVAGVALVGLGVGLRRASRDADGRRTL